ncbi:MAG: helix-turn-helix transcriptional regulator, partial [Candidatus Neomarinimicrobiota bacterium]
PWALFINMNKQVEIGSRLKQIRQHLEETQTVFGERFGCSRNDIANYERGLCDIPNRVLVELDKMGFGLRWLLNGHGDMHY